MLSSHPHAQSRPALPRPEVRDRIVHGRDHLGQGGGVPDATGRHDHRHGHPVGDPAGRERPGHRRRRRCRLENLGCEDLPRRLQTLTGSGVGDLVAEADLDRGACRQVLDVLARDPHGVPVVGLDPAERAFVTVFRGLRPVLVLRPRLHERPHHGVPRRHLVVRGCDARQPGQEYGRRGGRAHEQDRERAVQALTSEHGHSKAKGGDRPPPGLREGDGEHGHLLSWNR